MTQPAAVARAGALHHHDLIGGRAAQGSLRRPVVDDLGHLDLRDHAVVAVTEVGDELLRRRLAADCGEDRAYL